MDQEKRSKHNHACSVALLGVVQGLQRWEPGFARIS